MRENPVFGVGDQASRLYFLRSAQPRMEFILLKNVNMPKAVGILTLISQINTTSES